MVCSGVLDETMSTAPKFRAETLSVVYLVMVAGQKSIMSALPPRAGLKTFWPRPPMRPFTTIIAQASPTRTTQ